jgi:glutamyl-tRNA synthetase
MESAKKIAVRFPPSPTGPLHVGNARTILFNYLFAKKHGGRIILRFEDTDRERSKREYEENILEALTWLGLDYDEKHRQSEGAGAHKKYIQKMLDTDTAYISEEPSKDDAQKQVSVVRLRNKNKAVTFHDEIRGDITFDTAELGDIVIARSIEEPLYHLAVVIDDHEMGITHVIRGEDHISNTPRQILIQEAIGVMERPVYAHIPLILAPDRSKLSKRHGAVAVTDYRDHGYLPDAFINYLALLGWSPDGDKEIFTRKELIDCFDLKSIQKSGAIFSEEKLRWVNKQHMTRLPKEEARRYVHTALQHHYEGKGASLPSESTEALTPLLLERSETLGDITSQIEGGEVDWFFKDPDYEKEGLSPKDERDAAKTAQRLEKVIQIVSGLKDNDFNSMSIKEAIWGFATEEGRGAVLWPMRYALSGRSKSPDPFLLAEILGKDVVLRRLQYAIKLLPS